MIRISETGATVILIPHRALGSERISMRVLGTGRTERRRLSGLEVLAVVVRATYICGTNDSNYMKHKFPVLCPCLLCQTKRQHETQTIRTSHTLVLNTVKPTHKSHGDMPESPPF